MSSIKFYVSKYAYNFSLLCQCAAIIRKKLYNYAINNVTTKSGTCELCSKRGRLLFREVERRREREVLFNSEKARQIIDNRCLVCLLLIYCMIYFRRARLTSEDKNKFLELTTERKNSRNL